MAKRTAHEDQEDLFQAEKKVKVVENDPLPDEEAEWAAFQALIAESNTGTTEPTVVENEKQSIELADDEAPVDEAEEEDEVTNTWDEDDMNVDRRLENQEARKKYLEQLRAQRDARPSIESTDAKDESAADEDNEKAGSASSEDEDDDEDGWIK